MSTQNRDIDLLSIVMQTPGALVPIAWGDAGIGKSAKVNQLSRAIGAHLETVIASIHDPSDFCGLPVPENGHGVRFEPPGWAVRAAASEKGLVFFDEASTAPPAVQAGLLRVMLEGVVGELTLPKTVKFIAAANPPDQAAAGWDMSPPLANRFVHLKWTTPPAADWIDWLAGNDGMATLPRLDPEKWAKAFISAKALISAFIRRRPGLLCEEIGKVSGRFPLAYATPRTWECATRLLASCRALENDEAILPLMTGCLGEPVAIELASWLRANDLPDPEELLADPTAWKPDPKEPDRAFAVCLAVADAALSEGAGAKTFSKKQRADRWHAAWKVLNPVIALGKELVHLPACRLAKDSKRPEKGMIDADVRDIIGKLKEVVIAAGF